MIWRPDFSILDPFARRRRIVVPREYGLIKLDAGGRRLLNATGQRSYSCELPYAQARRCATGEYVDLWVRVSDGLPRYFQIGTDGYNSYYVLTDHARTDTPGPLATSQAGFANTLVCPCGCASVLPVGWTVTASGTTVCATGSSYRGSADGTWCVNRSTSGSGVLCSGTTPVGTADSAIEAHNLDAGTWSPVAYNVNAGVVANVTGDGSTPDPWGWLQADLTLTDGATRFWAVSIPVTNCLASGSGTSTYTISGCGVTGHYGYGGAITMTNRTTPC